MNTATAFIYILPVLAAFVFANGEARLNNRCTGIVEARKRNVNCAPKKTVIPILKDTNKYRQIYPTYITVDRCVGSCSNLRFNCMPVQSTSSSIKVFFVPESVVKIGKGRPQCMSVEVAEHTSCKCKCKIKKENCDSAIQVYNPVLCTCICKDTGEQLACEQQKKKRWDPIHCKCVCQESNISTCPRHYAYDYTECNCVPTMTLYNAASSPVVATIVVLVIVVIALLVVALVMKLRKAPTKKSVPSSQSQDNLLEQDTGNSNGARRNYTSFSN